MIIHPWPGPGPARTFREGGDTFQCQLKISICINRKWFPFPAVFPRKESELFSSSSLDSWHHGTRTKLSTLPASPGNCIIEVLFWLAISSVSFWLLRVVSQNFSTPLFKRQHCWQNEVTTWEDCESEGRGEMENWILDTKQPGTANKKYSGVFLLLCVIDCL